MKKYICDWCGEEFDDEDELFRHALRYLEV